MKQLMKPEDVGEILQIDTEHVFKLVHGGQLRAYKIAGQLRFSEEDFREFLNGCTIQGDAVAPRVGKRECETFAGRKKFSYSGSVDTGTKVWVGTAMQSPLKFTKEQWDALLDAFRGKTIPAGLSFDKPEAGSMGEWIKANWQTKMGPATYVGGILISEGYAERPGPGKIRFFGSRRESSAPAAERCQ